MIYALLALVGVSGTLILIIRSQKKKYDSLKFKFDFIEERYDILVKNKKNYEESTKKLAEIKQKYEKQIADINNSHGSDLSDKLNSL